MIRVAAVLCLLLLPALALAAIPVVMHEPGYIVVDGSYYVFAPPQQDGVELPAELHPRGLDGFDLLADFGASDCQAGSGNAGATPPGIAALRNARTPDALANRFDLRATQELTARIQFISCDNALVLFADTASGTTSCQGAIPFPFRRGACALLDANDPGHVFFDAFE